VLARCSVVMERFNVDFFGIRSYLFVELFPLCMFVEIILQANNYVYVYPSARHNIPIVNIVGIQRVSSIYRLDS
jgi:hypothetical protein